MIPHHDIVYIPPTIIISLSSHIDEATPCSKTKIVSIGNTMEKTTHLVLKTFFETTGVQRLQILPSHPRKRQHQPWILGPGLSDRCSTHVRVGSRDGAEAPPRWRGPGDGQPSRKKPRRFGRKPMKNHERATGFLGETIELWFFTKKTAFTIFLLGNDQLKWCKLLHIDVL